jgi:ABC-type Mn2+/Zn2+ transport system permease subunit
VSWSDILSNLGFFSVSLVAALSVAAICAYIGVYVVLKRIVFVGASLAQISSAGIGLAFLMGSSILWIHDHPLAVSTIVTLAGALLFSQQTLSRKVPQESIIGIGYLVAWALTLIFVAKSTKGLDEVHELLAGSIVTVTTGDLSWMLPVFGAVALLHFLFYKQLLFVSFDRDVAATQGYRVRMWELLFYLLLGVTISVSIQKAGLLSVFGYMVIPSVTGLVVARRMSTAFLVAIVSAVVATFLGFLLALKTDLPASPPTIAVSAFILVVLWMSRRFAKEA